MGDRADRQGQDSVEADSSELMPETCEEALARWDRGEMVWSVAMGEVGPSYEQQIQIMGFACVRYLLNAMLPLDKEWSDYTREALSVQAVKAAQTYGFAPSQAQVALAVNLAAVTRRLGWAAGVRSAPPERRIVVKRTFP